MKPATKKESIKVIKQMLRSRCRNKGITPNEKWLNDKALQSISYRVDEKEPFMSLYIPTVDMININKSLNKLNAWLDGE